MEFLGNDSVYKFIYVTEQIKNNYGDTIFSENNKKKLTGLYKDFLFDDYESKKLSEFFVFNDGLKYLSEKKFKEFDSVLNFYFVSKSMIPNNELLGLKTLFGYQTKKEKIKPYSENLNLRMLLTIVLAITVIVIIGTIIAANSVSNITSKNLEKQKTIVTSKKQQYVNVDSLNMRIGPGVEFGILTVLHINDSVLVIDDTLMDGWAYIEVAQGKGYVAKKYLSHEKANVPKKLEVDVVPEKKNENERIDLKKEEALPILDLSIKEIKE